MDRGGTERVFMDLAGPAPSFRMYKTEFLFAGRWKIQDQFTAFIISSLMVNCLLFGVFREWLLVGRMEKYTGNVLSEGEVGRDLGRSFCQKK